MSAILEAIERHNRAQGIVDDDDIESIDSDSDDEELRAVDRRNHGQLVLVRDNAVTGRLTPGGTEVDRDGWPVEPPVVLATLPTAFEVGPVIDATIVMETPPRSARAPVRRPNARLNNELSAAREQIRGLLRENSDSGKQNRALRAGMRRNAQKHRDAIEDRDRIVDGVMQENERLRKRIKLLEEVVDEFPTTGTEDTDYPITSAEKGEDHGKDIIDLTGDNVESENE